MRKLVLLILIVFSTACAKRETSAPAAYEKRGAPRSQPAVAQTAPSAAASGTADVGTTMPAYSAPLLDGQTFDIASERGNVVFLNLWATWCGPCRFEIPELQSMHEKYADRGLKLVGVSLDDT